MYNKLKEVWLTWLKEEYEVTFWFPSTDQFNPLPVKKTYKVKKIHKKTQKHFVATDLLGRQLEIKTTEPFDYRIVKKY